MARRSPRPKSSISQRQQWASVATTNAATDPEVSPLLAAYGFDTNRFAKERALLQTASDEVTRQVNATGEYRAATARAGAALVVGIEAYQSLAQVARAAFAGDRATLSSLGLDKRMSRTSSLFTTQALALFDNAAGNKVIADQVATYGYTAEKLTSERNKILALIEAVRVQESAKGAAQQATAQQNAAMKALDSEMSALRRVAKVALKSQPQLLEKLGIVARASRTPAQRHAGQKAAATRHARTKTSAEAPPKS